MSKVLATHVKSYSLPKKISKSAKKSLRPVTVVGLYDEEGKTLQFGAARCGKRDNFCRSTGMDIAKERATNNPVVRVSIEGDVDIRFIFQGLAQAIAKNMCYATRFGKKPEVVNEPVHV